MGWVVNATPPPLYPQARDPVPILYEAGWAPGPILMGAQNVVPTKISDHVALVFVCMLEVFVCQVRLLNGIRHISNFLFVI